MTVEVKRTSIPLYRARKADVQAAADHVNGYLARNAGHRKSLTAAYVVWGKDFVPESDQEQTTLELAVIVGQAAEIEPLGDRVRGLFADAMLADDAKQEAGGS